MSTRERILKAAEEIIRSKGLVRATTREIAKAAGLSEGALYKHFESKEDLFLSLIKESPTNFVGYVMSLRQRVGTGTVEGNLKEVAMSALEFFGNSFHMGASLFAAPELLARTQEMLRSRGIGPHKANEAVAHYLRAERDLGRVRDDVDADTVAYLMLGACFQRSFIARFLGDPIQKEEAARFVDNVLKVVMRVL